MQSNTFEAPYINESEYNNIKLNNTNYEKWLVGFAGFQLSYGAMWFTSYRKDSVGVRDYAKEAITNTNKQAIKLQSKNLTFRHSTYQDLIIPKNSFIYCDPPYEGTVKYKGVGSFDHDLFWQWCRDKSKEGHTVFVSEYNAPEDFKCVWEKDLTNNLNNKKATEKLFTPSKEIYETEK